MNHTETTETRPPTPVPGAARDDASPIDMVRMMEVSGGDDEILTDLLQTYLSDTREQLTVIYQALTQGSCELMERHAHSLAGSSSTCGVTALAAVFRRMEAACRKGRIDGLPALYAEAEHQLSRLRTFLDSRGQP
jgi:HPt (histidine-containing phosphotransfer) domain-containing protein